MSRSSDDPIGINTSPKGIDILRVLMILLLLKWLRLPLETTETAMDGGMGEWEGGWVDGWVDGQTDRQTYTFEGSFR